jgi:hypothetical protein
MRKISFVVALSKSLTPSPSPKERGEYDENKG